MEFEPPGSGSLGATTSSARFLIVRIKNGTRGAASMRDPSVAAYEHNLRAIVNQVRLRAFPHRDRLLITTYEPRGTSEFRRENNGASI